MLPFCNGIHCRERERVRSPEGICLFFDNHCMSYQLPFSRGSCLGTKMRASVLNKPICRLSTKGFRTGKWARIILKFTLISVAVAVLKSTKVRSEDWEAFEM